MAKLSLTTAPTFTKSVAIPVPGRKPVPVDFTFKGRTRDAFREYLDGAEGRDDVDMLMDTICGWELEDEFSRESVEQLVQNYAGSARAIIETYVREVTGARLGN